MQVHFLGGNVPLTKTITPEHIESYPSIYRFTSETHEISTSTELYEAIVQHAELGHCLLKGNIKRPLINEPRRDSTSTDEVTSFICLDFDQHKAPDIQSLLDTMGLGDISYVVQYSAKHGLPDYAGTINAHVFMLLSEPMPAPMLKAWLMAMNLTHFKEQITLAKLKTVLHWPLDITTCQNDKLIFIAPPTFVEVEDPLFQRIRHVKKQHDKIQVSQLPQQHISTLRAQAATILNNLRTKENLPKRTASTSMVGTVEVLNKPDQAVVTGIKQTGEFIRLNLNGGDSWAYWHPLDNFELIHDFKSGYSFRTKELAPGYYADCQRDKAELNATPTDDGDLILAFRDKTTAEYWNGLWNPSKGLLDIHKARNETQLEHWMLSHGRTLGSFIPIWDIEYNPRVSWTLLEDEHRINSFITTSYMKLKPAETVFPTILGIIKHMLGYRGAHDDALLDTFLNWIACIFQRQHKPTTAWVVHGTEGTGKGYFVKSILTPILGETNVQTALVHNLEDTFNAWIEKKLFIFIDEIDTDDFKEEGRVTSRLRNYITENMLPSRGMRTLMRNVPNYASFLFSSNKKHPVHIPLQDRRYNVANFQPNKLPRPDDMQVYEELEAFAQFLLNYKADFVRADTIIKTEARTLIQQMGVTSLQETCNAILEGDYQFLWNARPDEQLLVRSPVINQHTQNSQAYLLLLKNIATECIRDPVIQQQYPLTRDEMQIILQYNVGNMPVTPNKFTSLLRHNGIMTRSIYKNGETYWGIHVDWKITPKLLAEVKRSMKIKPLQAVR